MRPCRGVGGVPGGYSGDSGVTVGSLPEGHFETCPFGRGCWQHQEFIAVIVKSHSPCYEGCL